MVELKNPDSQIYKHFCIKQGFKSTIQSTADKKYRGKHETIKGGHRAEQKFKNWKYQSNISWFAEKAKLI